MTPDHQEELEDSEISGVGTSRDCSLCHHSCPGKRALAASISRRLPVPGPRLGLPPGKTTTERALGSCHMACPRPSSKSQTKPSSQMQWGRGLSPPAQCQAAQISMRLARRRQRGASAGTALRLISFPSRRSTCSLEKFMTSTTVQKLLMENSLILFPWR